MGGSHLSPRVQFSRDRDNHFARFYLISCPLSILLICAEVDVAELGTDLRSAPSSPLSTAKHLSKEPMAE